MDARVMVGVIDLMFSDSSSSEESDIDLILSDDDDDNHRCNLRPKPRITNYVETIVINYNDIEFRENFRLRRSTFEYILFLITPDLEGAYNNLGRFAISPRKQLLIARWVLGTPDSYRSVTSKFGVGQASAWRAVFRVVKVLCKFRNYFITWPNQNEARQTSEFIEQRYGFPDVIGAVDGTHIQITAPKRDSQSYINRKGVHSIQLQVVCNEKLEFIHCYTGMPGSVHDMRVFKYSGIQQRCNEIYFPHNTHLLGDSAYTLQQNVLVPFRDNGHLNNEQVHFNNILSRSRMIVERSIGLFKARWRYFADKLPMRRTDLIPCYILGACVLHNICLKRDDRFEYPVVIPDNLDVDVEPLDVDNASKLGGTLKRERIKDALYINH